MACEYKYEQYNLRKQFISLPLDIFAIRNVYSPAIMEMFLNHDSVEANVVKTVEFASSAVEIAL